jgi:Na+-transporting NADH:ubiquinone oxidoreductase subunit C
VVLVLCLVCSIIVAGSAVGLKPRQQEQRALDKQRNICRCRADAAGHEAGGDCSVFAAHLPRLVDLKSGELLEKDPAPLIRGRR